MKNCLFCNNEMELDCTFWTCKRHGEIRVESDSRGTFLSKEKLDYYIVVRPNIGDMILVSFINKEIHLPLDKNLTPENFEQKLKTYLTFQ